MFEKAVTDDELKESVEKLAMELFGKKYNDEITVYRMPSRDLFSKYDYVLMSSKNMPGSTITLRYGGKGKDVSIDYMEVYYRELHIRPLVEQFFAKSLGCSICVIFNCADHAYGPVNTELTLDEFMQKTGVSFDILIAEEDFKKSGKDFFENEVLKFLKEGEKKAWKYRRVTLSVYDRIPSEKVNGAEQFKIKWENKCTLIRYIDFFLDENGTIEKRSWTEC